MNGKKYFFFCYLLSFEEYPDLSLRVWIETKGGLKSFPCSACPLPLVSIITYTPVSTISFIDWKLSMPWVISLKIMDFFFFMLSCSTTHMFEVHVVYVYANTYKKKCVCKYISVFSLKVCS